LSVKRSASDVQRLFKSYLHKTMSTKVVKFGEDARKNIFKGIQLVAKTVMVTM